MSKFSKEIVSFLMEFKSKMGHSNKQKDQNHPFNRNHWSIEIDFVVQF